MRHLLALALTVCAVPAAAERMIVVSATGPSAGLFPRGAVLDERRSATLQPLDRVIVVDKDGTRVFSGPGPINFGRGTATPSRWDDIRTLVTRTRETYRRRGRARAGATRGLPEAKPVDPVWAIEWPAGGRYCFDPEFGMLIHVPAGSDATVAFHFTDSVSRDSQTWEVEPGATHLVWPGDLLPAEGKERSFAVRLGNVERTVTLAAVPVRTLDPLALAEYLTSRQCEFPLSMFADKADQMEGR